jgi:hypothetical protein
MAGWVAGMFTFMVFFETRREAINPFESCERTGGAGRLQRGVAAN